MKFLVCFIALILTGCVGMVTPYNVRENKLDVAPQFDYQVPHPEWGRVGQPDDQVYRDISAVPAKEVVSPASNGMRVANVDTSVKRNASGFFNTPSEPGMSRKAAKGNVNELERFLARSNIRYEVLPGEHKMVRLLDAIYFQTDSLNMTDQSRNWLNEIARYLASYQGVELIVEGYTDDVGDANYNEQLSEKRAQAVKNWISSRYKSLDKIYVRGFGGAMPVCDNSTSQGRACNRRVELLFILPA